MNGVSMSQASIHDFNKNSKRLNSPISGTKNAHVNFLNSSMKNKKMSMNNSQWNLTTWGKKIPISSQPASPKVRGAISPSTRNRLNTSTRIRSSASMISSTSSKEYVNIRARPILIDDGKPLMSFSDLNYEVKPTYYQQPRTVSKYT